MQAQGELQFWCFAVGQGKKKVGDSAREVGMVPRPAWVDKIRMWLVWLVPLG
jgi:hypothetical protein